VVLGLRHIGIAQPEARCGELVRVGLVHDVDVDVRGAASRVCGRASSAETRGCEVESSPEKLHRARLTEELGAKPLEDEARPKEGFGEKAHSIAVVRPDLDVLAKRHRGGDLVWNWQKFRYGHFESSQRVQQLEIELGDRHGAERKRVASIATRDDVELV